MPRKKIKRKIRIIESSEEKWLKFGLALRDERLNRLPRPFRDEVLCEEMLDDDNVQGTLLTLGSYKNIYEHFWTTLP